MRFQDSIKRRMEELARICNNDDEGFRSFLITLGQEMIQEPGALPQVDIDTTDEEIDEIMHGRGPTC
jgi:hypothetical protein